MKESIADFTILAELYGELDIIISKLDLSYEGIRCYAGSVIRSWMFQLQRREANDRHIHAAAFIGTYFSVFRIRLEFFPQYQWSEKGRISGGVNA